MSYKTILAILQDASDSPKVLDCVAPFAERFESHVIGLHAEPLPIPYATPMGFPDADFMTTSSEVNKERAAKIKATFEERMRLSDLSYEWRSLESFSGDAAVSSLESARAVDLIVAQQRNPDDGGGASANIEALLFETGRPVLFAPYALPIDTAFEKILVAWNGTREAARAVFDALPLIKAAREVEVFTVDPDANGGDNGLTAGAQIATALARHGANVTVESQQKADVSHGEAIQNRVSETGSDLLVTGAFSQSRLKEFFFGGVTRSVLHSMPSATFMSR